MPGLLKSVQRLLGTNDIKASAVTGAKIASTAVGGGYNCIFDPINDRGALPGMIVRNRQRYFHPEFMQVVDGTNKYGSGKLLRFIYTVSGTQAGKYGYCDEGRMLPGDIVRVTADASSPSGTYRLNVRIFDSAGAVVVDTVSSSTLTMDGTVQQFTTAPVTVLSNSVSILLWFVRVSGTSDLDIHGMNIQKGEHVPISQSTETPELYTATRPQSNNLFDHPYNENAHLFPNNYHGKERYLSPTNGAVVLSDPANPYKGDTLRSPTGLQFGLKIYRSEKFLKDTDYLTVSVRMGSASTPALPTDGMGGTLKVRAIAADGVSVAGDGLVYTSNTVFFPATDAVATVSIQVPTDAAIFWIWVARVGIGTPAIDVYEWWANPGMLSGIRATQGAAGYALRNAQQIDPLLSRIGENYLQQWRSKISRQRARNKSWKDSVWTDTGVSQIVVCLSGDSWNARENHYASLRDKLQAKYGDGGVGWMSATINGASVNADGWTQSKSGTWTDVDANEGAGVTNFAALGIELTHTITTDIAALVSWTLDTGKTADSFDIHYGKQSGGGTFQVQIDALGWSADIPTANATTIPAVYSITGLADTVHTISIRITGVGSTGVILHAADAKRTSVDGVRVLKCGNGSATSDDFVQETGETPGTTCINTTYFKAQLALAQVDVMHYIIGTNDRTQNDIAPTGRYTPTLFYSRIGLFVDMCRAAIPLIDILLVSSSDTGNGTVPMELYDQNMRIASVRKKTAFLSMYMLMSPNSANIARHLMHPVSGGNDSITNAAADNSRHWTDIGAEFGASAAMQMYIFD